MQNSITFHNRILHFEFIVTFLSIQHRMVHAGYHCHSFALQNKPTFR